MHANGSHIKNHRPASACQSVGPKTRKQFRLTLTTDGTWFTVHGDKKGESGFELRFSTDAANAEVSVHTDEPDRPEAVLRLYPDRTA